MCDNEPNADEELESKEMLERRKLDLEIKALKHPVRTNPALWLTSITTILAVSGFFVQLSLNKSEAILAEKKIVQAETKTERAEIDLKKLNEELESKKEQIAYYEDDLEDIFRLILNSTGAVPEELKRDILERLPLDVQRKFYDPTGKHPFHLPPHE